MPLVSAPARPMSGRRPSRAPLLRRGLLLVGLLSAWLGPAPAWAQQAAGGVTVGSGAEEATVVADQIQQVGGSQDLLIAVGNVEIVRGQSPLLADRVELIAKLTAAI